MQMTRQQIIEQLTHGLIDNQAVHALWLEGADGTGTVDEYSDIDVVIDVADGAEDAVFAAVAALLTDLAPFDLQSEGPRYDRHLRTKFYHLVGTPEWWMIDLTVQSHSRSYEFVTEDESTTPKVLFDKAQVVRFRHLDRGQLLADIRARLIDLENMVGQRGRAIKYARRGQYLEAMAYYHKYLLGPLVEALRMLYVPVNYDMWLIHVSRQLPPEVVRRLEGLYQVGSTAEIEAKVTAAAAWFAETAAAVRGGGGYPR